MSPEATLAIAAIALLGAYIVAVRLGTWLAKIVVFAAVGVALGPRLAGIVDPHRHAATRGGSTPDGHLAAATTET